MFRTSRVVSNKAITAVALVLFVAGDAWAASYKVLYNFNSNNSRPSSGVVIDAQGNAYGATLEGGIKNSGTVYELSPSTGYHLLHAFGPKDPGGNSPMGSLVLDVAGNLYGTTAFGGGTGHGCPQKGCGAVFELSPPSSGVGLWTETVVYTFCSKPSCIDGASPQAGVISDSDGNLYGTTFGGGEIGDGTVFELSPISGGWTESVLHGFGSGKDDGVSPVSGLIFDSLGNLYGTTQGTLGDNPGTVFELSPSESGWQETVLYVFGLGEDGANPQAGLAMDAAGNLYGTTVHGGSFPCGGAGCGTVFELSPSAGGWTETIIHNFDGGNGANPAANLVLDSLGNLYGTTSGGGGNGCSGFGCGTAFELFPGGDGSWIESLFRFGGGAYGGGLEAPLTLGFSGVAYGTTVEGGANGGGVVFRITQ